MTNIGTILAGIIFVLILYSLYRFFVYPFILYIKLGLILGFEHVGLNYRPLTAISTLNEEGIKKYGNVFGIYLQKVKRNPMMKLFVNKVITGTIVMICDAQMIRKMSCEHYKNIQKKNLLIFVKEINKGLLFEQGQQWKNSRSIISNLFHFQMLKAREYLMENVIKDKIKNLDGGNAIPDLLHLGCSIGGQIVVKSLFGEEYFKIMFGNNNPYEQIRSILHMMVDQTFSLGNILRILFLNRAMNKGDLFQSKMQKHLLQKIKNFKNVSREFLIKQKQRFSKGQSVSPFIEAYFKEKNPDLYIEELIHQLFFFLFAAEDTTGSLIEMCLALLSKYPQYQQRILKDVEATSIHSSKEINNFINQVTRLHSVINIIFPRVVVKSFVIDGIEFKKGTAVTLMIGSPMRNLRFWDEPSQFNPDRFNHPLQNSSSFIPFVSGPRNCIGQHMALMQVRILIVRILEQYKLQKVGDSLSTHSKSIINNLVNTHYVKFHKK